MRTICSAPVGALVLSECRSHVIYMAVNSGARFSSRGYLKLNEVLLKKPIVVQRRHMIAQTLPIATKKVASEKMNLGPFIAIHAWKLSFPYPNFHIGTRRSREKG